MIVLIRGGGDLASGVALRLYRAGLRVVMTELAQPMAIRRLVSFAEAIPRGEMTVESVTAKRVADPTDTLRVLQVLARGFIPVLIDPEGQVIPALHPLVVIDARMLKRKVELIPTPVKLIIGLGPGFVVGENCHAVIETKRGHMLGRVLWSGSAEENSGLPEPVASHAGERVLKAPQDGILETHAEIGEHLEAGHLVADVDGAAVYAPFPGVLRGVLHPGLVVKAGQKIGDVDPRDDPSYCSLVSDKSLAIGGGALEAILSRADLRPNLWI
jgi:xanthine dehydrogenase accessory factor